MNAANSRKKRQDLPGEKLPGGDLSGLWTGLWIVATPIGNLSDLSERGRLALQSADRILCEDTRRVSQLLHALGLSDPRPLVRLDAHATSGQLEQVLQWLESGENLALVTDAGTPGISDPGAELVRLARERHIRVSPVPGPSAVTALLSVSGFGETAFSFRGFFPRKPAERDAEVKAAIEACALTGTRVQIWFESPQRVLEALGELIQSLDGALAERCRLCVGKELTKSHEEIWTGSPGAVLERLHEHFDAEGEKGEWCFALLLPSAEQLRSTVEQSSEWVKALRCLLEPGEQKEGEKACISASEAARKISQYFGTPKREAYEMALKLTGKK